MKELNDIGSEKIVELLKSSYEKFVFVDYGTSSRSTSGGENTTPAVAYEAYAKVLEGLYYNQGFPNGEYVGIQPWDAGMEENSFVVLDIDGDGRDELVVNYVTAATAGQTIKIYDYDSENGVVREELSEYPWVEYYENGAIKAYASHNHGRAPMLDDWWPYSLYVYDKELDKYKRVAIVDAWQEEYNNEDGAFPKDADIDKDGILYYAMKEWEYDTPLDFNEYNEWLNSYIGDAKKIIIVYMDLTLDNINSIRR